MSDARRYEAAVAGLADDLARPSGPASTSPVRRWAVISATNAGPPLSVDLLLGGTTIPAVRYLASYSPTVGDTVVVDITGNDPLVVGKLA